MFPTSGGRPYSDPLKGTSRRRMLVSEGSKGLFLVYFEFLTVIFESKNKKLLLSSSLLNKLSHLLNFLL